MVSEKKNWPVYDKWKHIIFSDEIKVVLDKDSGIQFNLLLSPYPCFISLLYLDLHVLGDDALIS